ncbi:hypothetical protein Tco_1394108 [Tanacetum coccineum]
MNKNEDLKVKIVSKFEVKTDKSKPVTSCSSRNNEQGQKKNANILARGMYRVMKTETQMLVAKVNMFSCNSTGVASSSSVKRPESKDTNSNIRVLLNTKSKRTSKDVKKSQSSVSLVFKKHDTKNSNVSKLNANVLKAKTVNAVHDGSNLVCVSYGKDFFVISHDKYVARYALSLNSKVKRALFTSPVVAKSSKLGATPVIEKSKFSVATPETQQISGCSKHMTGNLKLLRNFVDKFMGTVRFVNDNFAAVTGYGDYF